MWGWGRQKKKIGEEKKSDPKPVQLGLCCLNTELRAQKPPIFCSRTMIIICFPTSKNTNKSTLKTRTKFLF